MTTYKELVTQAEGEIRGDGVQGYFSGKDDAGNEYSIAVYDSGRIQIEIRGQPLLREAKHWWRLANDEAAMNVPVLVPRE